MRTADAYLKANAGNPGPRWAPGDHVVLRETRQGRVWSAKPATVVRDDPDLLAFYVGPGTRWKRPRTPDGHAVGVVDLRGDPWTLTDATWQGGGVLILALPGAGHALLGFRDAANRALAGWYLNLQKPFRRTAIGFDYLDQLLDVVVSVDRRAWSWKDEDALAEARARGLVDGSSADAIRSEGERALQLLRASAPPYAPEWERWSPDPSWTVPRLPDGWEETSR